MGGRGGFSGVNRNNTISTLQSKMETLARYALPGNNYDEKKARQYYKVKNQFNRAREKYNRELDKKTVKSTSQQGSKTFVNSFGEATKRNITSQTYERQQKSLEKEISSLLGVSQRKKRKR